MKPMLRSILVAGAVLLSVAPARAQDGDDDTNIVRATVEAIEWKRQDAMVREDTATLEEIYDENVTYTHSLALTQTRSQLLEMMTGGGVSYNKFTTSNMSWQVYPAVVVGNGTQAIDLTVEGRPVVARIRYTVVYAMLEGKWRCVAYQSTALPDVTEQQKIR
jgi:hypothetical protein